MSYLYLRQNETQISIPKQKEALLAYASNKQLTIDNEVVEYSSARTSIDERKQFESFLKTIKKGDVLMAHQFSTLSTCVEEVVKVINCVLGHEATLHIITTQTTINRDTQASNIFPHLNALQNEETNSQNGIGRPKGSLSASKFDKLQTDIIRLLKLGNNVSAIARELKVSRSSLKDYIESRNLKMLSKESWQEVAPNEGHHANIVLICPFEQKQQKR